MATCYCMGPQNGQPLCPCRMRSVEITDGRYIQAIDLGPVPDPVVRAILDRMKQARDTRPGQAFDA